MNTKSTFSELFNRYQPSAWALVAANVAPLLGVVFLGWEAFDIVALYWAENVIIGMINVLKILTCNPDLNQIDLARVAPPGKQEELHKQLEAVGFDGQAKLTHILPKLFLAAFFAVHYGIFCLVHGMFVIVLLGPGGMFGDPFDKFGQLLRAEGAFYLILAAAAIAASHLVSFFYNYLGHGENRRTLPILLMFQPYARIVVLHIAILFGGFVAFALGSGTGLLVLLIAGKTILDLTLHFRERERNNASTKSTFPDEILTTH